MKVISFVLLSCVSCSFLGDVCQKNENYFYYIFGNEKPIKFYNVKVKFIANLSQNGKEYLKIYCSDKDSEYGNCPLIWVHYTYSGKIKPDKLFWESGKNNSIFALNSYKYQGFGWILSGSHIDYEKGIFKINSVTDSTISYTFSLESDMENKPGTRIKIYGKCENVPIN